MKIGIFDSGIGGINVLREAVRQMPDADFVYYSDSANAPYGTKTPDEVRRLSAAAVDKLLESGAEAIIIACNTATSAAAAYLREKYPIKIVGMEPAVKPALEYASTMGKKVLVIATKLTIEGEKLRLLIDNLNARDQVGLLHTQDLVSYAERLDFNGNESAEYLKERFAAVNIDDYCAVVLGCTHFNYFFDELAEALPDGMRIFDGNEGTVRHLRHLMTDAGNVCEGNGTITVYESGVNILGAACEDRYRKLFSLMPELYERVFG